MKRILVAGRVPAMALMAGALLVACEVRDYDPSVSAEAAVAPVDLSSQHGYRLIHIDEEWQLEPDQPPAVRLSYEFPIPETKGPLMAGFSLITAPRLAGNDAPAGRPPSPEDLALMQTGYERVSDLREADRTEVEFLGEQIEARLYRGTGVQHTGASVPVELMVARQSSERDIITMVAVYPLAHVLELDAIRTIAREVRHPFELYDEDDELRIAPLALVSEDPDTGERIINHYVPEQSTMVARSHAVADYQGCVATWVGPNTALTAAHCGSRSSVTMEVYPDGDFDQKYSKTYSCNADKATAFWASNSDLRVIECGQGQYPAPGDIYGWVDYSILGHEQPGDPVYSVWTNPIDNIDGAGSSTRLYSEGEVLADDSQTWANPNCERPDHWYALYPDKPEPPYGHRTSVYGESGASGSLQFSALTHTAVIAPLSTAPGDGGNLRFASSIGQILEVEGYIPPGEVYWLETDVDTSLQRPEGEDRNEDTGCMLEENQDLLQNVARSNASGSLALDVHEEIDDQITQRPIYNLDFNSEWRRLFWTGQPAFDGFHREIGYSSEEPWQTHARLSTSQPGGASGLGHSELNLALGEIYDVRIEYAWSGGTANLPDLEFSIDGCAAETVSTSDVGQGGQNRGYHWVHLMLDASGCPGASGDISIDLASAGTIDLRRVVIAQEEATWDFESWDTREPWTESRPGGHYDKHALTHATIGSGRRFAAYIDPENDSDRGLGLPGAPIRADECYKMHFDARAVDSTVGSVTATVESGSTLGSIAQDNFSLGGGWSQHSIAFDTEVGQADAVPRFTAGSGGNGRIAIDNVRFVADPHQDADLEVRVAGNNPRYVQLGLTADGFEAPNTSVAARADLPTCDDPDSNRLDLETMEWLTDDGQSLAAPDGSPQLGQNATIPGSYLSDGQGGFQPRVVMVTYAAEGRQDSGSVELRPCVRQANLDGPDLPIGSDYPACPRAVVVGGMIDDLIGAFGTADVQDLVRKILTFQDYVDLVHDDYPGCQPTWCPLPHGGSWDISNALERILEQDHYQRVSVDFLGQMVNVLERTQTPDSALQGLERLMTEASRSRLTSSEQEMLLAAYSTTQAGLAMGRPGEAFDQAIWSRALTDSERPEFFRSNLVLQPAKDALGGFINAVADQAYTPRHDDVGEWLHYGSFGAAVGVASAYRQFHDEPVR
ncbi:hypothetical protein IC757_08045 [Wenzhouxiangella sp. AB-CW3]|uniref:DUF6517 family protein n=1 Tax=Wenzhouxiangella sp. AB-CW3 TaxID=2771012 RepID=UPI00168BD097|nr:DUF6517 family protein [Wenzhouxiangella sp. AB-CW3]QOC24041.1 hypothetical protein IC757_08045 [Wenzhouxiangella sp. AB-CW3]